MDLYETQSSPAPTIATRPNDPRPDPRPSTSLTASVESTDEERAGSLLAEFEP